jgi:hypothetical protein
MALQPHFSSKARRSSLNQAYVNQKGAALILLVFLLALIFTAFMLHSTSSDEYKVERDLKTSKVLEEAKSALLGWSAAQDSPGQLPCPEDVALIGSATEGVAQLTCVLPAIGRLPWRTLGLGEIQDANNDKLWYVISDGFRTPPINTSSVAQLSVDGIPNSAVAIIFSVGRPLGSQSRPMPTASSPPNISQYLDLVNNAGTASFVSTGNANNFNDRLMTVTKAQLFESVTRRILGEIQGDSSQGLKKYYIDYGAYPFADIDNDGFADNSQNIGKPSYKGGLNSLNFSTTKMTNLLNNGWYSLIDYNYATLSGTPAVTLSIGSTSIAVNP